MFMENIRFHITVKGIVVYHQKVLLMKKGKTFNRWTRLLGTSWWWFGIWGNTKRRFKRELKEETGLLIDVVKPAYTFTKIREDYQTVGIGYLAYSHDDQVTISFEHTDYKWCSIDELKEYLCDEIYQDIVNTLKEFKNI